MILQKEKIKKGEGTCLQYPSCKGNDTLAFNFQREGVLSWGHQDSLLEHDGKVKHALRQCGPWNLPQLRKVICKKLEDKNCIYVCHPI